MNIDKISNVLTELIVNTQAEGAIVFSIDGLPIVSEIRQVGNEEKISAISASLLSLGTKFSSDVKKGNIKQVYIEAEEGHIVFKNINRNVSLAIFVPNSTKLGIIFLNMNTAISSLQDLF